MSMEKDRNTRRNGYIDFENYYLLLTIGLWLAYKDNSS